MILVEQADESPAVVKRAKVACCACPSPETAKATLALKIAATEHQGGRVIDKALHKSMDIMQAVLLSCVHVETLVTSWSPPSMRCRTTTTMAERG